MDTLDDSAFLSDLLAYLDDNDLPSPLDAPLNTPTRSVSTSPAPKPRAKATRQDIRIKRERDELRVEVAVLTQQLEQLCVLRGPEWAAAKQRALAERRHRRQAEDECRRLRLAVYSQRRFIGGLNSVFSATPRLATKLDVSRYLHLHTRLARHRQARWSDFDDEANDARLRLAMDVICHETEAMMLADEESLSPDTPYFNGEIHDDIDSFTVTTAAVYPVDAPDLDTVVRAACVAIRNVATMCALGHELPVSSEIVDIEASPATNMLYRILVVEHPCDATYENLVIETHAVTSYKITEDAAVVVWDFVDVDEMHPTSESTTVTRSVTGACLIRREWCRDNVERIVFRSLVTGKHRFLDQMLKYQLRQSWCQMHPPELVRRKEWMFRRVVNEQLAVENAIYGQ